MEQYIYDESNGLWYELNGNYYIPYLKVIKYTKELGMLSIPGDYTIKN
jgi:hypothetical protein